MFIYIGTKEHRNNFIYSEERDEIGVVVQSWL